MMGSRLPAVQPSFAAFLPASRCQLGRPACYSQPTCSTSVPDAGRPGRHRAFSGPRKDAAASELAPRQVWVNQASEPLLASASLGGSYDQLDDTAVAVAERTADSPASTSGSSDVAAPVDFFGRAWAAYSEALDKHPILVKSATSFFGFLIGDLLAQTIVGNPYDVYRTMRLVLFGMFMDGPVGHVWYTTLDKNVMPEDPKCNKAVVTKMLLDQFLWAPFFSCVFFTFINLIEGHPDAIMPCIHAKLLPMMLANYGLWPIAHLINFKFIPSQQRILYINCVQIVWSAYMSNLSAVKLRSCA